MYSFFSRKEALSYKIIITAPEQLSQPPPTLDEIDVVRHREITSKAVSAILLLVLKWFKVSRTSFRVIDSTTSFD